MVVIMGPCDCAVLVGDRVMTEVMEVTTVVGATVVGAGTYDVVGSAVTIDVVGGRVT